MGGLFAVGFEAAGFGVEVPALEVAAEPLGILRTFLHFGHLPDFPAISSGTDRDCPHWQVTRIGIRIAFGK
jgi:hypothetical protein